MDDEFQEFIDFPHVPPTAAEDDDSASLSGDLGDGQQNPEADYEDDTGEMPHERDIIDRKGRRWHVSAVEDSAAEETITLRYRHVGIEVLAQDVPAGWGRLPSSKLLELAGLD